MRFFHLFFFSDGNKLVKIFFFFRGLEEEEENDGGNDGGSAAYRYLIPPFQCVFKEPLWLLKERNSFVLLNWLEEKPTP